MSTASGLMVSVAGTISFDLWRRGPAHVDARRRRFRLAALGGVLAPVALALVARGLDISVLVGWAFALAASTFCPLLLLGIWWERLTARGAASGLVAGAGVATGLIFTGLALEGGHPTVDALLTQPAVISVPVAFGVMVLVSLRDRTGRRAADAELLAMHAPEGLGLRLEGEDEAVLGSGVRA
jgi:Na+(H+)/acetate symporter ActP